MNAKFFLLRSRDLIVAGTFSSILAALAGCDSGKTPQTPPASPTPEPPPAERSVVSSTLDAGPAPVPASATPEPEPEPTPDPVPDSSALASQFRQEADASVRSELVEQIWNLETPAAVESLRGLFVIERDEDVKTDILSGLVNLEDKTLRTAGFPLFVAALAPGQPADVRLYAAHLLSDFDDARANLLLNQYLQDADAEVREAIQDALDARKALNEP